MSGPQEEVRCNECGGAEQRDARIELVYRRAGAPGELRAADVAAQVCAGCGMTYIEPSVLMEIEARFDRGETSPGS